MRYLAYISFRYAGSVDAFRIDCRSVPLCTIAEIRVANRFSPFATPFARPMALPLASASSATTLRVSSSSYSVSSISITSPFCDRMKFFQYSKGPSTAILQATSAYLRSFSLSGPSLSAPAISNSSYSDLHSFDRTKPMHETISISFHFILQRSPEDQIVFGF